MNVLLYLTSKSYRKHRWVARHLFEYRAKPHWLMDRRWSRITMAIWGKQIIGAAFVNRVFGGTMQEGDVIHIPEIGEISSGELLNGKLET